MKDFKSFLKEEKNNEVEVYHYSHKKFDRFDPSFLTGGHDQKGPGLYTSNEHESHYGPNLHRITLDTSKFLKPNTKVKKKIITDLIERSPHLEDVASNYDENPHIGKRKLIDACCRYADMHEALERVWYDGYKADNHAFLDNVKDHYHGTMVKPNKFRPSVSHYIIWHPKAIKRIVHDE